MSAAVFDMLESLRKTNSSEEKIALLQVYRTEEVEKVLKLVYTPHQTWGITSKVLHTRVTGDPMPSAGWWLDVQKVFTNLATRRLSGEKAKTIVRIIWNYSPTPQHADLFKNILDRDLRIGVDTKTLNKAYPNFIEVFECQLAKEYNPKFVTYPVYVEPKIDGIRALAIEGKLYSRTGSYIPNFVIEQYLPKDLVLDGELFAGDWAKTISARADTRLPMEYFVFDRISLEEWKSQKFVEPLRDRYYLGFKPSGPIEQVASTSVDSLSELEQLYSRHLDNGYEGVMIKDPKAPYSLKRSRAWMKLKPTQTLIAEVIDIQEGTGRNEGALGALVCKTEAGWRFNVGTGFSEEQRRDWWNWWCGHFDTKQLKITVKYQSLTVAGAPLFPRFISCVNMNNTDRGRAFRRLGMGRKV